MRFLRFVTDTGMSEPGKESQAISAVKMELNTSQSDTQLRADLSTADDDTKLPVPEQVHVPILETVPVSVLERVPEPVPVSVLELLPVPEPVPAPVSVPEPTTVDQQEARPPVGSPLVAEGGGSATKLLVLEPTNSIRQDSQLSASSSSSVIVASKSATQLPPSGTSSQLHVAAPKSLLVLEPSTSEPVTQLLILEPQRDTHLQAKPAAVHESGNMFKVQLRKRSQVGVVLGVQLLPYHDSGVVSQDPSSLQRANDKPVNDLMAVQLRKISLVCVTVEMHTSPI